MAEFAAGMTLGVVAGFFLYPLYWSWSAWREHQEASRRARRIEDVLADMTADSDGAARLREEDERRSRRKNLRSIPR
jgi:hypothetical protein